MQKRQCSYVLTSLKLCFSFAEAQPWLRQDFALTSLKLRFQVAFLLPHLANPPPCYTLAPIR